MKEVLHEIEIQKEILSASKFAKWLTDLELKHDVLAFIPSMTYFVLGFRDILELAKREDPKSALDFAINAHCEEDKEHWKWFLNDLQNLGYLNGSCFEFASRIWSDEERIPRNMIYFVTYLIQKESNPKMILTVIECLEAAFAVFIEKLKPQLLNRNVYERLTYFGQRHDLGEQSHALGSWIDDIPKDNLLLSIEMNEEERGYAISDVKEVFAHFNNMFEHWYNVSEKSTQKYPNSINTQRSIIQEAFSN